MAEDALFLETREKLDAELRLAEPSPSIIEQALEAYPVLRTRALTALQSLRRAPKPFAELLSALLGKQPSRTAIRTLACVWKGQSLLTDAIVAVAQSAYGYEVVSVFYNTVLSEVENLKYAKEARFRISVLPRSQHDTSLLSPCALLDALIARNDVDCDACSEGFDTEAFASVGVQPVRKSLTMLFAMWMARQRDGDVDIIPSGSNIAWNGSLGHELNELMRMFDADPTRVLYEVRKSGNIDTIANCIVSEASGVSLRSVNHAETKCSFLTVVANEWNGADVTLRKIPEELIALSEQVRQSDKSKADVKLIDVMTGVNQYLEPLIDVKSRSSVILADLQGVLNLQFRATLTTQNLLNVISKTMLHVPVWFVQTAMERSFDSSDMNTLMVMAAFENCCECVSLNWRIRQALLRWVGESDAVFVRLFFAHRKDRKETLAMMLFKLIFAVVLAITNSERSDKRRGYGAVCRLQRFLLWHIMRIENGGTVDGLLGTCMSKLNMSLIEMKTPFELASYDLDECPVKMCHTCSNIVIEDRSRKQKKHVLHVGVCTCIESRMCNIMLPSLEEWTTWEGLLDSCVIGLLNEHVVLRVNCDPLWVALTGCIVKGGQGQRDSRWCDVVRHMFSGFMRSRLLCCARLADSQDTDTVRLPTHVVHVLRTMGSRSTVTGINWFFSTFAVLMSEDMSPPDVQPMSKWTSRQRRTIVQLFEQLLSAVPRRLLFTESSIDGLPWSEVVHAERVLGLLFPLSYELARCANGYRNLSVYTSHVWQVSRETYEWEITFPILKLLASCSVIVHGEVKGVIKKKRKHDDSDNAPDLRTRILSLLGRRSGGDQ